MRTTTLKSWPNTAWAIESRIQILQRARVMALLGKQALRCAGTSKNIPAIKEFVPRMAAEARDIALEVLRFRENQSNAKYGKVPNWVSATMRVTDPATSKEDEKESSAYWWALEASQKLESIDFSKVSQNWQGLIETLDFATMAAQKIQKRVHAGPGPGSGEILKTIEEIAEENFESIGDRSGVRTGRMGNS